MNATSRPLVVLALALLGACGCRSNFDAGTIKPDSAWTGSQGGHLATSGSVGSGGSFGTGGWTGTLPLLDASPVEDASIVSPDVAEPDGPGATPDGDSRATGSGGATGGGMGTGGLAGTGGAAGTGGNPGAGGTGLTGGTTSGSGGFGGPCTTNQDCPSDASCCNASVPTCDGTRLPAGDKANPGELVVSADGLVVTDTITGLLWQRDGSGTRAGCGSDGGSRCSWYEASTYCASLALGGLTGWRLPGKNELFTITDLTTDPSTSAIDQTAFPGTPAEAYWTSSISPVGSSCSGPFYVDFANATVGYCGSANLRVRCVRGSRCYPTTRFVVIDDGASEVLVRDELTGLVWQRLKYPPTACATWVNAQSFCSSLGASFRLPTLKELDALVTTGLVLDRTIFQPTACTYSWTSSPYGGADASETGTARYSPAFNVENWSPVRYGWGVRCVR